MDVPAVLAVSLGLCRQLGAGGTAGTSWRRGSCLLLTQRAQEPDPQQRFVLRGSLSRLCASVAEELAAFGKIVSKQQVSFFVPRRQRACSVHAGAADSGVD